MADTETDDEELSPRDELLRLLGTQDDADSFIEALGFIDGVVSTLMAEFSRRFPTEFSAWCEENEIDEEAVQELVEEDEEDATD